MEHSLVIGLLIAALVVTLLALVRQVRLQRALRRLLIRLLHLWKNRHAPPASDSVSAADDLPRL